MSSYIELTGPQEKRFWEEVTQTFTYSTLDQLMKFQLPEPKKLQNYAAPGNFRDVVFEVLQNAQMEGWRDQFLLAVRYARPQNPVFLRLHQHWGLSATSEEQDLGSDNLQALINANDGFVDVDAFRTRMGEAEGRVCRIELGIPGQQDPGFGTGSLVAPDIVLTNHHVMEKVIDEEIPAENVTFRFDYKKLGLNEGTTYGLKGSTKDDWLIDHSPYSQADKTGVGEPGTEEMDYALVRLSGAAGGGYVGGADRADAEAQLRGFLEIAADPKLPPKDSAVLILQHPSGDTLKLAIGKSKGADRPADPARLRYDTNAKKGSSGSPCFDVNWNFVALHHAGDPNFHEIFNVSFNQGVPIKKVRDLINKRGHGTKLGAKDD